MNRFIHYLWHLQHYTRSHWLYGQTKDMCLFLHMKSSIQYFSYVLFMYFQCLDNIFIKQYMVYSVPHYTLYALWLPPNALNECRKTSVRPSRFPDLYQTTAICSLSLSFPFIHEACWNKHFAKTMLSYLTLNLMQRGSAPPPPPVPFWWLCLTFVFLLSATFGTSWPSLLIEVVWKSETLSPWLLISYCFVLWLFSLTCIDYYAYR